MIAKKKICACVNGLSYLLDNIAVTLREHAFKKNMPFHIISDI